jgi:hypothetical protein
MYQSTDGADHHNSQIDETIFGGQQGETGYDESDAEQYQDLAPTSRGMKIQKDTPHLMARHVLPCESTNS